MKWISIIGAAAVLVVSVFIVGLATAADTEKGNGTISKFEKHPGQIKNKVSVYTGTDFSVSTAGSVSQLRQEYDLIIGITRGGDDVDVFCGVAQFCPLNTQGVKESELPIDKEKGIRLNLNYYKGSCWVCAGGFCFKVC